MYTFEGDSGLKLVSTNSIGLVSDVFEDDDPEGDCDVEGGTLLYLRFSFVLDED